MVQKSCTTCDVQKNPGNNGINYQPQLASKNRISGWNHQQQKQNSHTITHKPIHQAQKH